MNVFVSSHLHGYTGGASVVSARGATLADALQDLERQFPGIRFRIIDEQDNVRQHIKIFINQTIERNLDSPVQQSDDIHIIGALSGG
jgi:molybdopterin synthase sulfur carrier subunit